MTPAELREWRTARNLSRVQVAELLGVPPTTIRDWEQGHRGGPPGNLLMLALAALDRVIGPARTGPPAVE